MLGWKILFMNPEKAKGGNEDRVQQIESLIYLLGMVEPLPIDGDLKGYLSGRSTRTFHTPPSYGAVHEERGHNNIMSEHCWGQRRDFYFTEHHIPSFMHSNGFKHCRVISISCTPLSSAQEHNREKATGEMSYTHHFSLRHFLLFYAVMYFSPGELSASKSLHIIHRHQRGREWDCASVWCSPRIAVCNRNLMCHAETERHHRWLKTHLLRMNGGERACSAWTHVDRQNLPFLFGIVWLHHKQGQTPTSCLSLMCNWWWLLLPQMLRTACERSISCWWGRSPHPNSPQAQLHCFLLCRLRPGFNPFYVPGLLWRTSFNVPHKRMTEILLLAALGTTSLHALLAKDEMWSDYQFLTTMLIWFIF